jgi:hypothetical protein
LTHREPRIRLFSATALGCVALLILAACMSTGTVTPTTAPSTAASPHASGGATGAPPSAHAAGLPRPDHVVVVIEENHSYSDVIGN